MHDHPATEVDKNRTLPFRQYMTDDGSATGTSDMQVVASAASPSDFYVEGVSEYDIYIKALSFQIVDASAVLNKFGNVTALTNGVQLLWVTDNFGTVTIHDGMQSNFDFVRMAMGEPGFGDGAGAFRGSNVSGTAEGYLPVIDFAKLTGNPWGLRLKKNTRERLVLRVQDDTTGVDAFDAIAYGSQI